MSNPKQNAPRITKTRTGVSLVRNANPSSIKSSASRPGSSAANRANALDATDGNDLSAAFGQGGGKVYIKGQTQDEDELAWGGVKRNSHQQQSQPQSRGSPAGSGASTPALVYEDYNRQRTAAATSTTHRIGANTLRTDLTRLAAEAEAKAAKKRALAKAAAASGNGGDGPDQSAAASKPKKPSSREVRRLEKMIDDLKATEPSSEAREGEEACFCQARLHPLSTYTPSCSHCGLVLCHLQSPHLPCPSCKHALLTPLGRQRVIDRLNREIVAVEAREEHERLVREQEEQLRAIEASGGGAFPNLPGGAQASSSSQSKPQERSRKVITIGGGVASGGAKSGKRPSAPKVVTYTSVDPRSTTTTAMMMRSNGGDIAPPPAPQTRSERKAKPTRVARPLDADDPEMEKERQILRKRIETMRAESGRRWAGLGGVDEQVLYIEPSDDDEQDLVGGGDESLQRPAIPGAEVKDPQQSKKKRSRGGKKGNKKDAVGVAVDGQDASADIDKQGAGEGGQEG